MSQISQVLIQSVVPFAILEQYQRRSDACRVRLLGAILGSVSVDNSSLADSSVDASTNRVVAHVRHCFAIPHSEVDSQIAINSDHYRNYMQLHRTCYGKDSVLLGWYSVQQEADLQLVTDAEQFERNSNFIREFFAREAALANAPKAVHLSVTIASDGQIKMDAFSCPSISASSAPGAAESATEVSQSSPIMEAVPMRLSFGAPEHFALDSIAKTLATANAEDVIDLPDRTAFAQTEMAAFEARMQKLDNLAKDEGNALASEARQVYNKLRDVLSLQDGADALSSASLDVQMLVKDRALMDDAISRLKKELDRADQLLLVAAPSVN